MTESTYFRDCYDFNVLTANRGANQKLLIASGLKVCVDIEEFESTQPTLMISLDQEYVAVSAKNSRLLLSLDALEAKHAVLPSHIFQIFGGEARLYPISYDVLVKSHLKDEFGMFVSSFIIDADPKLFELHPLSKNQRSFFWFIKDESLCGDTDEFFRDVWDFNRGVLSVISDATILNAHI